MDFGLSPEQEGFRAEVRAFMEKECTPEVQQEVDSGLGWGPATWELMRKLGSRGWLTPAWPKGYGGLELSDIYKFIVAEEMDYHGGPTRPVATSMAGPTILLYGTEEQKREFLPPIARAEVEYALGYTEPQAGSDLAALQIRAVDQGDYYLMNGQKVFNTATHYATHHWLGARTDQNVAKHRGISLFVVDLKSPGITIRPLWVLDGIRTNEVFYEDVKVPKRNRVGDENRGWYYIATALDFERVSTIGGQRRTLERILAYARETKRNGKPLSQDPVIRRKLADLMVRLGVGRALVYRMAWMLDHGIVPNYEAALTKAYTSEMWLEIAQVGMELLGLHGQLQEGSKWAPLQGQLEVQYRRSLRPRITAGTSEVMRNIVALRGLNMPR